VDSAGQAVAAGLTVDKAVSFGERWENQAVSGGGHSGSAASLPARTTETRWHGDVNRGGVVTASDRPGRKRQSQVEPLPNNFQSNLNIKN
jgi:hypothetical protein